MRRPYYLFSNGRLRRRQNTLFLERADAERTPGAETHDDGTPSGSLTGERVPFPVEHVAELYLFGEVDINAKLVTFLAQQGIPAHFFDYYGNYTATLYPRETLLSGRLKVAQVQHYLSKKRRLVLARSFIDAGLHNILRTLRYQAGRAQPPETASIQESIACVQAERQRIERETGIPELMAVEGRAREAYYRAWPAMLGPRLAATFPFEHRTRRPPSNAVNAALSFGNALCYALCLKQLHRTALDPTVSFLHEPGDRRFSLALDLAEVFKPILVDRAIFRMLKTGTLQPKHFQPHLGGVYLTETGRKRYVEHWDERVRRTVRHRRLGRHVSYGHLVRLDAFRLCRHLLDPAEPYEGLKMWW
ncbi:MAG: type I-B CRISPR-associated endonuclease Cas1b [Bacteroidota bacterium]